MSIDLWPEPNPLLGDGSAFGESDTNDGSPGSGPGPGVLLLSAATTPAAQPRLMATASSGVLSIPSPFYSSRKNAKIRLAIFHTTEGARTVQALGSWFQRAAGNASSHQGADDTRRARYVPDAYSAWTARSANPISVNLEMCAFAKWDAAEWDRHPGLLENAAQWAAEMHLAHGIPLVHVKEKASKTGTGFCDHHDITVGWRDGSHTDCGLYFPMDRILARAAQIVGKPTPVLNSSEGDDDPLSALNADQQVELFNNVRELMHQAGYQRDTNTWGFQQLGGKTPVNALADVRDELTKRLPNRAGPGGAALVRDGKVSADTVLGYAANADGFGYRLEAAMVELHRVVEAQAAAIQVLSKAAASGGIDPAKVQEAVAAAIRDNAVKVNVTVAGITTK